MNFEPFYHTSIISTIFNGLIWASFIGIPCALIAVFMNYGYQEKAIKSNTLLTLAITGGLGLLLGVLGANAGDTAKNETILISNVSQKYKVQNITFEKRNPRSTANDYPEQAEPQNVIIKTTDGKSRPAIITQNTETLDPTITDIDTGKEMTDLLK